MTYVLLTRTENPWIAANQKNGFWLTTEGDSSTPYEVLRMSVLLHGGMPNKSFNLKTNDGYIYPNRQFNKRGEAVIALRVDFLKHNGSDNNEYWVQYI